MGLVAVFGSAWTLYKRNLVLLIVAGVIAAVASAVITVIVTALGAMAGLTALHGSSGSAGLLGAFGGAFVGIVLGLALAQLIVLVLQGGMFKMAISSARSGQAASLGELFSGFTQLPSYLVYGLICSLVVPGACAFLAGFTGRLLGPLALLVMFPCALFCLWLYVGWLYTVPLIADRRLGPIAALRCSRQMVGRVGWWSTFALLFLFGLALVIVFGALVAVVHARVGGPQLTGLVDILVMPFVTCYIAAMYLGSEPRQAAPSYDTPVDCGPYGDWSAATPAYGTGTFTPPSESYAPTQLVQPVPASGAAAWAAAADPLAAPSPTPPAPGASDPGWLSA